MNQPDTISLLGLQSEWERFRKCSFHFMNIDLLKESRGPLEFIREGERCHVWFSNIFDYHWKMYEEGYPHLEQKFDEMLCELSGLENPCYLDLYRPAGGHIHRWSDELHDFNGGIQTLSK
ncbi:hypothetical protein EBT16_07030 [bacterium]|nr:hypothetical protein [bacterium]